MLTAFSDQFEGIYKVRRDSKDVGKTDPSMYLGSSGYAYTMHRVLRFLRYDAEMKHEPLFDIGRAQEMLDKSLEFNKNLLAADKQKKFEQQTNSFFMAASVGLNTLLFLEQMENLPAEQEEGKKDFEAEKRD